MGDEQPDDAMAAMMGFSAFGSNKRHKPNPENANRPPKPPTTSSNSTPLGIRPMKVSPSIDIPSQSSDTSHTSRNPSGETTMTANTSTSNLSATALPFFTDAHSIESGDRATQDQNGQSAQQPQQIRPEDDIGYASPWTGATLTKTELREYARGKTVVNEKGEQVTVFFKRSFVEDPWAKLKTV